MSTLSPLSTLTSPTPSWHTATAGSPASNIEEGTTPSSPGDPVPSPSYRDARLLPRELKEHCQIYLEEQLCKTFHVLATRRMNTNMAVRWCRHRSTQQPALCRPFTTICAYKGCLGSSSPTDSTPCNSRHTSHTYFAHTSSWQP